MVTNQIEDQIVPLVAFGEIFLGVIDHMIGADRTDKIDISRTANAGDLRAERFRDLDRESAHASGRAVHQNLLTSLNMTFVAETLQRGDGRDWNRSRLFERDVGGLRHNGAIGQNANVLGKGSGFSPEYFVSGSKVGYVFANRFNSSGVIDTDTRLLRLVP